MIQHKRPQLLVLWVIWASLFTGIIVYQLVLGRGIPAGENAPASGMNFAVVLAIGQIAAASLVRWLFIPRAKNPGQLLVFMIVGLALSEAVEFYGLFLVSADQPSTKLTLWVLSLLSALQFIPTYAKAEGSPSDQFRTG